MTKRPDFTDEEAFLLQYVLAGKGAGQSTFFAVSYLLVGFAVAAWGLFYASPLLTIAGLIVLGLGRIQEMSSDQRWAEILRTIVEKYETACQADDDG